ncbi:hypothetical protein LXL04_011111 [Taraxacum kok-saghyz]
MSVLYMGFSLSDDLVSSPSSLSHLFSSPVSSELMISFKMSILDIGSSFMDDLEMKEGVVVQLNDDVKEMSRNNGFDLETEFEFWPVQHPTEPSHEDRPVQCPIPHSSHLITDDRFSEQKRPEVTEASPIRTVRKRHHDNSDSIAPLLQLQTPTVDYHQLHQKMNTTVFNKFHQVHRFES